MSTSAPEYTLGVTEDGQLPADVLHHLDARYWNIDEKLPGGGGNGTALNAKEFGAKGDGSADDTAALSAAVAAAEAQAKALFIPAGRYVLTAPISPRGGFTIFGEDGTVLAPTAAASPVFWAAGSYMGSKTIEMANTAGIGDRTIQTKGAHGFVVGDVVRLVSQRVATSADAGEYRLGWGAGSVEPRFAEFVRVMSVPTPDTITLDSGLIFPGYRPDGSQETHTSAGTSALLMLSNGRADGTVIRDMAIDGDAAVMLRLTRAKNVRVENVQIRRRTTGRGIELQDCYQAKIRRVRVECDYIPDNLAGEGHADQNVFHVAACQSTGFEQCEAIQGTQSYDITYNSTIPWTSSYCYVKNCASYNSLSGAMTAHPGTFAIAVIGNNFNECLGPGIAMRANGAIVANNQISGSNGHDQSLPWAGIYIYEGGGKRSLISTNTVRSFKIAMRINDGAGKPFTGWIGATISNNVFEDFEIGAVRVNSSGTPSPAAPEGLILKSNTFHSQVPGAIGVLTNYYGNGSNGWSVTANDFWLPITDSTGILVRGPSGDVVAKGNTFHRVGQQLAWDPERVTTSSPVTVVHWGGNTALEMGIDRFPPPTAQFQMDCTDGTLMRLPDTAYSLNFTRWSGRYFTTAAGATVGRGWPVEGFEGWVDAIRLSSTLLTQFGYGTDGRRHSRALDNGAWTNWKVV